FSGMCYGLGAYVFSYPKATILDNYNYDDGPWLTWNADPTSSICISWLTKDKTGTHLKYGLSADNLEFEYSSSELVHMHKVFLSRLSPDTVYYYQVPGISLSNESAGTIYSFRTAPVASRPFKFCVVGDMQPDNEEMMARNRMVLDGIANQSFDFTCQVGDVADSGADVEDWHKVLFNLPRVAAYMPFQSALGNHDFSSDEGSNFATVFTYNREMEFVGRFYSFDYLNAHFVMIDNFEHLYVMTPAQLDWLEKDLKAARAEGKWIFCFFHYTIITSGTSGSYFDLQQKLFPVFDKYGVDAVFFGHDHHYEHWYYQYGGDGMVYDPSHSWNHSFVHYFCTGGGGAWLETEKYGLLSMGDHEISRTRYNITSGKWVEEHYIRRHWNPSRNYTLSNDSFGTNGVQYYHDPDIELYQDEMRTYGYTYGENTMHYIEVSIFENQCNISVHYPDGSLMAGPNASKPQLWSINK
ncbi:MAG: metallophosphoesterase, partial [Promethearchaeota archaeon]